MEDGPQDHPRSPVSLTVAAMVEQYLRPSAEDASEGARQGDRQDVRQRSYIQQELEESHKAIFPTRVWFSEITTTIMRTSQENRYAFIPKKFAPILIADNDPKNYEDMGGR